MCFPHIFRELHSYELFSIMLQLTEMILLQNRKTYIVEGILKFMDSCINKECKFFM